MKDRKTTQCQSKLHAVEIPIKSSSCTWPNCTPEKHLAKIKLFLFKYVSFGILIESLKLVFFHRRFEVCKCLQPD